MRPELSLIAVIVLLFFFDLFVKGKARGYFQPLACLLMTVHVLVNVAPSRESFSLFGGMYQYVPMMSIVTRLHSSKNSTFRPTDPQGRET